MANIAFKDYLRSNQLNREVSAAVRYAKDTPGKTALMREHFAAVLAQIDSYMPKKVTK